MTNEAYEYDVALSFAGEDRIHADALAEALRRRGLSVFYDTYEKSTLWGKNLYTYLSDVYENRARYCIMFLSQHYAQKLWTNHEREAAQARAFAENEEYILPVRLDRTKIPGIPLTVSYLSWPPETAETIADAIMEKLGKILKHQQISTTEVPQITIASQLEVMAFTHLEGKVYEYLKSHIGEVCDREDIKLAIWGENILPSNSALQKIIERIRIKIDDPDNPRYLISVRGRGYTLRDDPLDSRRLKP